MAFDVRQFQKYLSPNAFNDLNAFIEGLPARAGNTVLIAGACAWLIAGLLIVYSGMQASKVMALRGEILKAETLKPTIPTIAKVPVSPADVEKFGKYASEVYKGLEITSNGNKIDISATDGVMFGAFREAIGHTFNSGEGWNLAVNSLCVGRECKGSFLQGSFNIERASISQPQIITEGAGSGG